MKCGLLGRKLGHSYSPAIHSHLGNYDYLLFEKDPEQIQYFLKSGDFHGLNVTIPYKKDVIPYCSELSETARRIGAVNTIVRKSDGTLIGHNTDFYGFSSMLLRSGLSVKGKKVLVLGTGGASITVQNVLNDAEAQTVVISRNGPNNYNNLHLHSDASVIVNCTPVGMFPNCPASPLSLDCFKRLEGVLDLVYNPARTKLLMDAEQRGIIAENGLWMLVAQAKESAEWFLGHTIPDTIIETVYRNIKHQSENIILIGMPGCGKSTIAKHLGQLLGRPVVDSDAQIIEAAGKSIPDIFSQGGESLFRSIETKVLKSIGQQSGLIIATGGGCVTKQENYTYLHQNGIIIYIRRDLSSLAVDGRPLSQRGTLEEMFRNREPLYQQFADCSVDNCNRPSDAADAILQILHTGGSI